MIAPPLMPISRAMAAYICSIASSMGQWCKVAIAGGGCGAWLSLCLAVTKAADGWLTMGPVAQSTLIVAAVLRRLTGK